MKTSQTRYSAVCNANWQMPIKVFNSLQSSFQQINSGQLLIVNLHEVAICALWLAKGYFYCARLNQPRVYPGKASRLVMVLYNLLSMFIVAYSGCFFVSMMIEETKSLSKHSISGSVGAI